MSVAGVSFFFQSSICFSMSQSVFVAGAPLSLFSESCNFSVYGLVTDDIDAVLAVDATDAAFAAGEDSSPSGSIE